MVQIQNSIQKDPKLFALGDIGFGDLVISDGICDIVISDLTSATSSNRLNTQ